MIIKTTIFKNIYFVYQHTNIFDKLKVENTNKVTVILKYYLFNI